MQLFESPLECKLDIYFILPYWLLFSDPHFDGRQPQQSGRNIQTVGGLQKVTKSRSLDRSKNRSADTWSQEDFEKTNRMAMRELQSVKRSRNQSMPMNVNESNNRVDQTTRQSSPQVNLHQNSRLAHFTIFLQDSTGCEHFILWHPKRKNMSSAWIWPRTIYRRHAMSRVSRTIWGLKLWLHDLWLIS